jgi:hypothetical protein
MDVSQEFQEGACTEHERFARLPLVNADAKKFRKIGSDEGIDDLGISVEHLLQTMSPTGI